MYKQPRNLYFLFYILFACLISCKVSEQDTSCLPDVPWQDIELSVDIIRTDSSLFACQSPEDIRQWLDKHNTFAERYLMRSKWPNDSLLVNELYKLLTEPHIDTLYQEVTAAYGDMGWLKQQLEQTFRRVKYYFPDFVPPGIYTFLTGYGVGATVSRTPDLSVQDSLVVIGMEFFMGPQYRYQPDYPLYISRRYHQQSIVPFILQPIAARYIRQDPNDNSMLADMIFYGKVYYFVKSMLPCLNDTLLFGFTQDQLLTAQLNEQAIWQHYIDKSVLFTTNHLIKKDYIDPAPFCFPISRECPGEIGRWTGYLIVKQYHERHPHLSLPELLAESDSRKILQGSKYKGNYYE